MIIIDDLLLRSIGISIPPFDMIWMFETIKDFAEQQRFNLTEIEDKLKENRMLFELGEISEKEFKEIEEELKERMKIAEEVRSTHLTQEKEVSII